MRTAFPALLYLFAGLAAVAGILRAGKREFLGAAFAWMEAAYLILFAGLDPALLNASLGPLGLPPLMLASLGVFLIAWLLAFLHEPAPHSRFAAWSANLIILFVLALLSLGRLTRPLPHPARCVLAGFCYHRAHLCLY